MLATGEHCVSVEGFAWAMSLKAVSPMAKFVAAAIGDVYPPWGEQFAPVSLDYIMRFTNGTEAFVRTAIVELIDETELLFEERELGKFWFLLPLPTAKLTPREPDKRETCIYVISRGTFSKIGISRRGGNARMKDLQHASPGESLILRFEFWGVGYLIRKAEDAAKKTFDEKCVIGEWFDIDFKAAIEVVKDEIAKAEISPPLSRRRVAPTDPLESIIEEIGDATDDRHINGALD